MAEAEFIHRWFEEVWNNKREDAIDEMFAEDGIAAPKGLRHCTVRFCLRIPI